MLPPRTALVSFACVLAVTFCQTSARGVQESEDIPGFYFELLMTHMSDMREDIEQQLKEQAAEFREIAATLRFDIGRILEEMPGRKRHRHPDAENSSAGESKIVESFRTNDGEMIECRTDTLNNIDPNDRSLNGDWTVIQDRFDGSVDFYRPWVDYRDGFGVLRGEHWLGLAKVHAILQTGRRFELLVLLEDRNGGKAYAHYDQFMIGSEQEQFTLKKLGKYTGTAGDSLKEHKDLKFSTYDQDNDAGTKNCAHRHHGAWWFRNCYSRFVQFNRIR
ncbi:AGAP006914-PA-like protein [Anopheles sinensis]|uniref:AGAP006914-PA-like protein n=1 Tax=Anopheles sinensis TaxID=74873 RepID=A0A084WKP7_ANOSI|nr:AGAP006914-PA-like protein [Anopheles sinensis]